MNRNALPLALLVAAMVGATPGCVKRLDSVEHSSDSRLPKPPSEFSAPELARTSSTILFMWDKSPSADIASYELYRNDALIGSTPRLHYTATNLSPGTTGTFTVRTRDIQGRVSAPSRPVSAGTKPQGRIFNVKDYGAHGNGATPDTSAIQEAINACTPGGTVFFPPGVYLASQLKLKGNLTVDLSAGARLQFLGRDEGVYPNVTVNLPGPDGDVPVSCGALITVSHAANVTLVGGGTIQANGSGWWPYAKLFRPFVLEFIQCTNVFVQGITIQDPPYWNTHPLYVDHAVFSEVTFLKADKAQGHNGDGLNPDSCRDVLIIGCQFGNQDDSIAIKSGKVTPKQQRRQRACENIVVRDCRFDGHLTPNSKPLGLALGSENCGGIRNVLVKDCEFKDVASLACIKSNRQRRSAVIENIRVENCTYSNSIFSNRSYNRAPISVDLFYYDREEDPGNAKPLSPTTPILRNIHFKNIRIENPAGRFAYLCGLAEQPVKHITFENVTGSSKQGFYGRNLDGIKLRNVTVAPQEGPAFEWLNVKNLSQQPPA